MSNPAHLPSPLSPTDTRTPASYSAAENGTSNGAFPPTPISPGIINNNKSPVSSPTALRFDRGGGSHAVSMEKTASGRGLSGPMPSQQGDSMGWKELTPRSMGRAIGARFMRAARRGNLPFLIIFFSCTIVFFSALAGIGYVEPPPLDSLEAATPVPTAGAPEGGFKFGGPVFDLANDKMHRERKMAEQRALEESWAKKKRPMDGAWMRKQRDDKAIRRKPVVAKDGKVEVRDVGAADPEGLEKRDGEVVEKRSEGEVKSQ